MEGVRFTAGIVSTKTLGANTEEKHQSGSLKKRKSGRTLRRSRAVKGMLGSRDFFAEDDQD